MVRDVERLGVEPTIEHGRCSLRLADRAHRQPVVIEDQQHRGRRLLWISRPSRLTSSCPRCATRSSGTARSNVAPAQLSGVQHEYAVVGDLDQFGEPRQILLHVDHPAVCGKTRKRSRRVDRTWLHERFVERSDDDATVVECSRKLRSERIGQAPMTACDTAVLTVRSPNRVLKRALAHRVFQRGSTYRRTRSVADPAPAST